MKTEFAFKKEILACNGLFPLRKHKIWFGSNSWGEYFLRKKCELMSVLAVLELHLAQSIQLLHLYSFLCVLFLDKKSGFDFQDDVLTKLK